jgi:hypothetical protein
MSDSDNELDEAEALLNKIERQLSDLPLDDQMHIADMLNETGRYYQNALIDGSIEQKIVLENNPAVRRKLAQEAGYSQDFIKHLVRSKIKLVPDGKDI